MNKKLSLLIMVFGLLTFEIRSAGAAAMRLDAQVNELSSTSITAIAVGGFHTCALLEEGNVKCWGLNTSGQLGDGSTTDRSIPGEVTGLGDNIVSLAAGYYHTCALTSASGVKCWGNNASGQLGDGTQTFRSLPVDVSGLSSGVISITAGMYHTCALTAGGGAKCWGANGWGALGDGTNTMRLVPTDVSGLTSGVASLAAGYNHTCAVVGGGAKCWGRNWYGQVGDGTTADCNTPVDVIDLATGVSSLAGGESHTCATLSGGGVKCWGANAFGQLGDGNYADSHTPVDVNSLTGIVVSLAAGRDHTCAAFPSGEARCWGANGYGQIGDGTTEVRSSPAGVYDLASGVAALEAGEYHTCADMESEGAKCWGSNIAGQLGDWTKTNRYKPVEVRFSMVGCFLPAVVNSYCSDFSDDFSNPASGWYTGEDSTISVGYVGGEYRVWIKPVDYYGAFRAPTCNRINYEVEVDSRWVTNTGTGYGIAFGITGDFSRFYVFLVNTDFQDYGVYRYDGPDNWIAIRYWTPSSAINPVDASNHLGVIRDGSTIRLAINGSWVDLLSDATISGATGAGVVVVTYMDLPNADAHFDNFTLKWLESSETESRFGQSSSLSSGLSLIDGLPPARSAGSLSGYPMKLTEHDLLMPLGRRAAEP